MLGPALKGVAALLAKPAAIDGLTHMRSLGCGTLLSTGIHT